MNIDLDWAKFVLQVANAVGVVGVAIYTFIATRDKDNSQHIKAVEATLNKVIAEHAASIARMEMQIRYMPTPDQIAELREDMQGVKATQEAIQRDVQAMRTATNRIEDFLLSK